MGTTEEQPKKKNYPWKSFTVFVGLYLTGIAAFYPVVLEQVKVYNEILGRTSPEASTQLAGLSLIQPILLGIVAIYFGLRYLERVNLRSLIYEGVENKRSRGFNRDRFSLKESLPTVGLFSLGLAALNLGLGVALQQSASGFGFPALAETTLWQFLSNLLYSGFGQEVLLRLGVMTTFVYIFSSQGKTLTRKTYIIGLIFTAVLYLFSQQWAFVGLEDLPVLFWVRNVFFNGLDGLFYGWLFYKYHFEAAALSHMLTNALIMGGSLLLGTVLA